jgi:hypothetical protein
MRSNAALHPIHHAAPHPDHRAVLIRSKVICIHCYRTLGSAASPQKHEELLHSHSCAESRLARQPGAPPPFN